MLLLSAHDFALEHEVLAFMVVQIGCSPHRPTTHSMACDISRAILSMHDTPAIPYWVRASALVSASSSTSGSSPESSASPILRAGKWLSLRGLWSRDPFSEARRSFATLVTGVWPQTGHVSGSLSLSSSEVSTSLTSSARKASSASCSSS